MRFIVFLDLLDRLSRDNKVYKWIALLQLTFPLRDATHVDEAFELLDRKSVDAFVSACEYEHYLIWANKLDCDGSMANLVDLAYHNIRS